MVMLASDGSAPPAACVEVVRNIASAAVASVSDFRPAICGSKPEYPFAYDRALGVVRATREIATGEVTRASPGFALASLRAGDEVRIMVRVGAVAIERSVKAVQPATSGQPLFVAGDDGQVFSIKPSKARP